MDYKKYICPVCKAPFTEDDDVVVCPECGTPHHRSCWLENGRCANEGLHGNQEEIDDTIKNESYREETETTAVEEAPSQKNIDNSFVDINPAQTALIEGKPGVYYEIAVKKNQRYYIPRFLTMGKTQGKLVLWNFMAFIMPLSWSVYRKMYKVAAVIFALYIAFAGITGYYLFKDDGLIKATQECLQEDPYFMQDIVDSTKSGFSGELTDKQKEYIEQSIEHSPPVMVMNISSVLFIVCRVLMGINGTKLYFKKITKTIENGEKKGLTDNNLKHFLLRKNGTLPFILVTLVGIFEWMVIYL